MPDQELTAAWIAKVGKRDPAGVEKIVGILAKQYGAKVEQRADDVQRSKVVDFRVPSAAGMLVVS